jgi:REP element-mobilizing transposase RayT
MPRPPRDSAPGIHHVGSGAAGPANYFRDDVDRATWLRLLVATAASHSWTVIIVVQLSTHWHGIFDVPDHSLPDGMQYLNGEYSKRFNARHERVGYLVRDRYWSRRKTTDSELAAAYSYAANNPLAAGIVARPEDWRWSSYSTTLGLSDTFSFVDASIILAQFGSTLRRQRDGLRQYVTSHAGPLPDKT